MKCKSNIWIFDIIKPVAATLIVFHHYQQVFKCEFSNVNFYGGHFSFGYLVELFFMISGFLTLYTFKEYVCGTQLFDCFCHKLKRVFPIVTIACIFTLIIKTLKSMGSPTDLEALWNAKALFSNVFLLFSGYPFFSMIGYNNPTWYVAILIQCYAAFYILKYITNKLNIRFIVTVSLFMICVIILKKFNLFPHSAFRGFESFYIGVIICEFLDNYYNETIKERNKKEIVNVLSVVICFFIIISSCCIFFFPQWQRVALVFGIYPEIVIISFLYRNIKLNSKIKSTLKEICGISFEVYIWNYPFMATLQLVLQLTDRNINHSYSTMIMFSFVVWIICIFIYRFIEKPINHLIKTKEKARMNNGKRISENRSKLLAIVPDRKS